MKFYGFVVAALVSGCQFQPAEKGGLAIVLKEEAAPKNFQLMSLMQGPHIMTNPTAIADLNCFAVNITGPDVLPMYMPQGCGGGPPGGWGMVSPLFARGTILNMPAPRGPSRRIEVFGIYPNTAAQCQNGGGPNSNSVYTIGSKTLDLNGPTTVTIPISYAGAEPAFTCSGGGGGGGVVTMQPTLGTSPMFYDSACSSIVTNVLTPPTTEDVTGGNYALATGDDGSPLPTYCSSGPTHRSQVIVFKLLLPANTDLTGNTLRVTAKVASGGESDTNCTSMTTSNNGTNTPGFQAYDGTNWNPLNATTGSAGNNSISFVQTNDGISNANNISGYLYVRFIGVSTSATYACAKVDYISVELVR